jgi:hypothetical protein
MGGPLTVVVMVAAGGAAEPTTLAIERAAGEALGRTARVVVREAMGAPTDGEALAAASEANEGAVVEVTWSDRGHRVAVLRVHLAGRRRWMGRTLGFGAADADSERGRTIGLALASMLPDAEPAPAPQEAPVPVETIARPSTRARSEPEPEIAETPAPDTSPPGAFHYAMNLFGLGATALGSNMLTAGGGAAFETFLTPRFGLRIGGAVRGGDIQGAPAHTLTLMASAGLELHPWPTSSTRAVGASLRADYVLMNQTVTHSSAGGTDLSTMGRPLSGLDAVVEVEWRLGASADLLTGVGLEEMFATTYVDLNGKHMATLPPLSAFAQGGVRVRF